MAEEQWQRYRRHSPIIYVDRINAPLLLLGSENDYRCPIEQGEQMLTALRMRRRTVELIRVPGASHAIVLSGTPHQRYFQWRLSQEWFDRRLMGAEPAAAWEGDGDTTLLPHP
jgi:dipeptidyl aminopeptidase/acylaminoacyl peptidase